MALNVSDLSKQMLGAMNKVLTNQWKDVKVYSETEMKKLAQTIAMIEKMYVAGDITKQEARLHLQIQKNAARTVLLTVQGLGILAVENAINAALDVVKTAVNSALGFTFL